ncbi:hypothetical protein DSL72_006357 [Monilinia vaccinii-corymbosi]|uniref:Uncharacterized protein n=1 Tax=Monilinia vaccinii-corymbosi TaxID=61207 RepID=A0A8A3PM79_9HELO|nr:hypothetical protein DSL72_006357 [Monilinia vaccinii-corymbosi]
MPWSRDSQDAANVARGAGVEEARAEDEGGGVGEGEEEVGGVG